MVDVIDDLARTLFAFDAGSRTTGQVTAGLTRAIVSWASERGWAARTEARLEVPATLAASRLGYVDVLVERSGQEKWLAIEIDSTDKPWSVDKLRYAAAAGMRPVWVRWGDNVLALDLPDVDVIQLPAARRPADRPRVAQLGLWPWAEQ